ncbi:hypothetical protein HanIR_Chr11g0545931 [Helianthus annuus]|nr:hypothetical protein HanIR_Chr11g0545931 [Helianthus annuus]
MISYLRYKAPAKEREPCLKRSSAARVDIERGSQRSTIKVTAVVLCSGDGGDFKKRRPNSVQTKTRFGFLIVKFGNSFYKCGLTTTAFNICFQLDALMVEEWFRVLLGRMHFLDLV